MEAGEGRCGEVGNMRGMKVVVREAGKLRENECRRSRIRGVLAGAVRRG